MSNPSLQGRTALVTGAGSGIGRACALALAARGAAVAVTDINSTTARETHGLIKDNGGRSAVHVLDIADENAWESVSESVRQDFGGVTILVNNAALKATAAGDGGLLDTTVPVWDAIFAANLRGPMLGTRALLPDMLEAGYGSITMVASAAALRATPGFATAYSSAKAGMIGLSRSVAATYGPRGVRCNTVAPGVIMVDEDPSQQAFHEAAARMLQRVGRPSDIADTVAFLATDGAYINGQVIPVDGGLISLMPSLSGK